MGGIADIRDAVQAILNGDPVGAAMNAAGAIPGPGDGVKITGAIACYTGKFPWKARELGDRPGSIRKVLCDGTPSNDPPTGSKPSRRSLPDITAMKNYPGLIRPACTAARSFGIGPQETTDQE